MLSLGIRDLQAWDALTKGQKYRARRAPSLGPMGLHRVTFRGAKWLGDIGCESTERACIEAVPQHAHSVKVCRSPVTLVPKVHQAISPHALRAHAWLTRSCVWLTGQGLGTWALADGALSNLENPTKYRRTPAKMVGQPV